MIERIPQKATTDLNHNRDLLLALSRAAQAVQQAQTPDEIYQAVGGQIKSLGGDVTMLMLGEDRQTLTAAYISYAPRVLRKLEKLTQTSALEYHIVVSPDSVYARDIAANKAEYIHSVKEYFYDAFPENLRFLADQFMSILKVEQGILAPLRVEDETLGLMMVSGLGLDEGDVPAMESFAVQVAAGLQNARLMQKLQQELETRRQVEESLSHNRNFLLALSRAAQAIQRVRTAEEIYQVIGEQINALGFEATILTLDSEHKHLHYSYTTLSKGIIRVAEKMAGLSAQGYTWSISPDSIYGKIIETGKAEYIPWAGDLFEEALPKILRSASSKFMKLLKVEQGIIAPLNVDEEVLGLMAVFGGPKLGREDLPAIDSFAGQVAVSLRNARLAQQMQEELSARRQAEEKLQASLSTSEGIFNSITEAVYILDENGLFLNVNLGAEKMYSYPAEHFIGRTPEFLSAPGKNDFAKVTEYIRRAYHGEIVEFEFWGRRKDGSIFPKDVRLTPGMYFGRKVILAVGRDITERKQAQESLLAAEKDYRSIFEKAPIGIFQSTPDGRYTKVNITMARMYGYDSPQDMLESINDISSQIYLEPSDRLEFLRRLAEQNEVIEFESQNKRKDGSYIWTSVDARTIRNEAGENQYFEGFVRDITGRKQAEEAVRQAETHFKALIENAPDGIALVGLDGKTRYASPTAKTMLGYNAEDDVHVNSVEFIHPDDLNIVIGAMSDMIQNPEYVPAVQYRYKHKNGTYCWVESTFSNLLAEPSVQAVVINFRDITGRKQTEESLKQSEARYRLLADHTTDTIWLTDLNLKTTYISPSVEKVRGFTLEQLQELPLEKNITPASFQLAMDLFAVELPKAYADPNYSPVITLELEFFNQDGTVYSTESKLSVIRDESGNPSSILGESRDIADRKRVEKALYESEKYYRALIENAADGILVVNPDATIRYESPSVARMLGYDPNALVGTNAFDLIHPDDLTQIASAFMEGLGTPGFLHRGEYRLRHCSGEWRHIEIVTRYLLEDPVIAGIIINGRDITERKQADTALRESEARWQFALEGPGDGVWDWDVPSNFVYYSHQWKSMLGYEEHEIGNTLDEWDKRVHPDDKPECYRELARHFSNEIPYYQKEHRVLCKDGTYKWVLDRGKVIDWVEEGKPRRVIGTHTDITERKLAESALRESEIKFHSVITESVDGIVITDEDGRIIEYNNAHGKITGQTRDEMIGQFVWDVQFQLSPNRGLVPEFRERQKRSLQLALETGRAPFLSQTQEVPFTHSDGSVRFLQQRSFSMQTKKGWRLGSISRDITERKRSEEALRVSEERYRALYDDNPSMYFTADASGRILSVNKFGLTHLGYMDGELAGQSIFNIFCPDDRANVQQHFSVCLQNPKQTIQIEARKMRKDGTILWVRESACAVHDIQGQLIVLLTCDDITERKRAEEALQASEERSNSLYQLIRLMSDNLPDLVWAKDMEGHFIFVNKATIEKLLIAQDTDEPIGKNDLYFAERQRALYPDNPVWHTFGEICIDTDLVVHSTQRPERFEEFGNIQGEFLFLDVYKAPFLNELGHMIGTVGIGRDVTHEKKLEQERKHIQEALAASEAELRALFASMQDTVLVIDRDGFYQKIAPTNPDRFYIAPENVIGKHLTDFFPAELAEKFLVLMQQVLETRDTLQVEYALSINGQSPWFEASVSPMGEDCTLWVARDISERKQVEAKLQLQSAALEAAANTIVITDRWGLIQWANSSFTNLTGFNANDAIGKKPGDLIKSGKQDHQFYEDLWQTILSGQIWHNELINRRKDGGLYFEEMTITPLRNSAGEIDHFIAVKQDITERKRAEAALVKSEQAYRTLFENMPIGLYRTSANGQMLDANPALFRMFGYPDRLSMLEKNAEDFYADPLFNQKFAEEIKTKGVLAGFESQYRRLDNTTFWAEDYVRTIFAEDGSPLYFEGSMIDITVRKQAEESLRRQFANLSSLYQMTATLGRSSEIEDVYAAALDSLQNTLAVDRVSILLFDTDGVMRFKAWRGLPDAYRKAVEGHSPWRQDAQDPQPVLVPDVYLDPDLKSLQPVFVEAGIGALAFIPLTYQGKLLGKFMIYHNEKHIFSNEEIQLAQTIAYHIGFAIARNQADANLLRAKSSLEVTHYELQQALAHEQVLARTDGLTELYNRRYFFELAVREFSASIRYQRTLTIIMFDVDGFKQANDTLGHAFGDSILIQIAQVAASQVRDVDILARYGGDEFVILLPQTNTQQAFLIAERIRESVLSARVKTDSQSIVVTLSIGVAEIVHNPQDRLVEDVIRRADKALYRAKQKGRNTTVIFNEP